MYIKEEIWYKYNISQITIEIAPNAPQQNQCQSRGTSCVTPYRCHRVITWRHLSEDRTDLFERLDVIISYSDFERDSSRVIDTRLHSDDWIRMIDAFKSLAQCGQYACPILHRSQKRRGSYWGSRAMRPHNADSWRKGGDRLRRSRRFPGFGLLADWCTLWRGPTLISALGLLLD